MSALLNAAYSSPVMAKAMLGAISEAAGLKEAGAASGSASATPAAAPSAPDVERAEGVPASPDPASTSSAFGNISIPMIILAILILGAIVLLVLSMNSLSNEHQQLQHRLQIMCSKEQVQFIVLDAKRAMAAELTGVVTQAVQQGGTIESLRDRLREYSNQLYAHSPMIEQRQAAEAVHQGLRTHQLYPGDPRYNTIDTATLFDEEVHRAAERAAYEHALANNAVLPGVEPPRM